MPDMLMGVFDSRFAAERAREDLASAGVEPGAVELLSTREATLRSIGRGYASDRHPIFLGGVWGGGVSGAVLGLLIGIAVMSMQHNAWAPFVLTLFCAACGAMLGAGIGALADIGRPREWLPDYLELVERGGMLLVAHDVPPTPQLEAILERDGAVDVDARIHDARHGVRIRPRRRREAHA